MTLTPGGVVPIHDPRRVSLPEDILERAAAVGKLRFILATQRGQTDGFHEDSEEAHVMGAGGEAAFCWAYGVRWEETVDGYGTVPDHAPDWEIRTTTSLEYLKVRSSRKDKPSRRVTFVWKRGENDWHVLTRYIKAGDAQKAYPKRDPGNRGAPAHFVPLRDLLPITDIPHTIHAYWPVAGEPGHWECFFGHEVWKLEDHGGAIYEWPHPAELVRRPKAARPSRDPEGDHGAGLQASDGGVPPPAPHAVPHRGDAAPAVQPATDP